VTEASFDVEVTTDSAVEFAKLSGDWNPLHTDPAHAATTAYRSRLLSSFGRSSIIAAGIANQESLVGVGGERRRPRGRE